MVPPGAVVRRSDTSQPSNVLSCPSDARALLRRPRKRLLTLWSDAEETDEDVTDAEEPFFGQVNTILADVLASEVVRDGEHQSVLVDDLTATLSNHFHISIPTEDEIKHYVILVVWYQ